MDTIFTFWTLCKKYSKIEIPIIQRDYAQGRETADVEKIRKKFINDYLIDSLLQEKKVELDFVYGTELKPPDGDLKQELFIPLDGQQRLTTLFLLHWFIALKEGRVADARDNLLKFTYETRPSAHDFCRLLIGKPTSENVTAIKKEILESEWYDDEWDNDPTVRGMITMLDTFAKNRQLAEHPGKLFDLLINEESYLISFYFIPLKKFGLTENLYIRMNARGKMLTGFENFKSEFYKYISKFNVLLEEVKDKIEYAWVENLWDYREKDTFVVDKPFMQYLGFITEMLYYKNAKFRAASYETDFLDLKVLKEIYSKEENLKFLIFSLDFIKKLKGHNNHNILWAETTTVHHILESILSGKRDVTQLVILYSALCYFYSGKKEDSFYDFIRVVRNLFHNTADKSRREWPKLLKSISNLIRDENVYNILKDDKADDLLDGFYVPQKKEEIVKARLMDLHPGMKNILFDVEDNTYLKGNITVLLISNFISSEEEFDGFDLMSANLPSFNIKNFSLTFESYKAISEWNFSIVWGDTIISAFYTLSGGSRLTWGGNYAKHPSIITLVMEFDNYRLKSTLEDFLKLKEKQFINNLLTRHADLSTVTNVKEQLYLYYILHKRVLGKSNSTFFKKGYNFGWLPKEKGFSSIFGSRIENDPSFTTANPIFQTFDSRFRYNCGLRTENALDEEIVGNGRKHNPFELLIQWAED